MTEPLLSARSISMTFPGVKALDGVDFDVYPGEVHALIGENGAGKSTLVRILAGEIGDYDGEVRVGGEIRRFREPREAIAAGIAEIPQELQLVSSLSAAENVFLGREPLNAVGLLDRQEMSRRCREELEAIGESRIPPQRRIERLEAAQRQLVAIARALSLDARLIIMDEPTASLGGEEAARLESLVRRLCERGVAVVYISHKLDEVRRLAARVTVLRDGKRIVSREAAGLDEDAMVRLMVGREIPRVELAPLPENAPEALRVEGLSVADPNSPEGYRVRDVSLTVQRGEIVGLAGLIGAGRTELLLALTGALENAVTGRVRVGGRDGIPGHPAEARDAGLVLLPEERKSQAIFPNLSVAENTIMGELSRVGAAGFVSRRRAAEASSRLMKDTGVRAASPAVPIGTLSGGNQQKA
ncbi:MAG TPA: sugar ABC transporter ATP-binding protein, partial [Thermoanaerobaculia bacterium]|nr:sugar ABC transporter ATP-binding protein [Thermoanaerobaculia bacterium]